MMILKSLILSVLIVVSLSGCKQQGQLGNYELISQSSESRPKWIYKEKLESKKYVYFIASVRSKNSSSFIAMQRAQQAYRRYLSEQGKRYLKPVLEHLNQSNFSIYTRKFDAVLYKKTKDLVNRGSEYYWEEVLVKEDGTKKREFHNYVIIRLEKEKFYRHVRNFFRMHIRASSINEKQMMGLALQSSLNVFEKSIRKDNKRRHLLKKEPVQF